MNKYQLVNEKWIVTKTAQTYDTPGFMEEVGTYGTAGAVGGAGIGALVGGIGAVPGAVGGGIVGGIGGVISWLAGDGTAIKELSLKTATQYMTYVYGPAPFGGFGKFIEGLESSKEVLSYLDADYSKNVDAIKEDFDEYKLVCLENINASIQNSNVNSDKLDKKQKKFDEINLILEKITNPIEIQARDKKLNQDQTPSAGISRSSARSFQAEKHLAGASYRKLP